MWFKTRRVRTRNFTVYNIHPSQAERSTTGSTILTLFNRLNHLCRVREARASLQKNCLLPCKGKRRGGAAPKLEGCRGLKCPSKCKILQPPVQHVPTKNRALNSSKNPYLKKLRKRIEKKRLSENQGLFQTLEKFQVLQIWIFFRYPPRKKARFIP